MVTLILCTMFSSYLTDEPITLVRLAHWFNGHPFIFAIMIIEFISYARIDISELKK